MMHKTFISFLMIAVLSGCQYPFEFKSASEIRQEVLEHDPAFEGILRIKTELDEKIASLNGEQSLKAREIQSRMLSLKRELQLSKENSTERIAILHSQLDPQRSEIKQRIMEFSTEFKLKQSSLSAVRKMIAQLDKLIRQGPEHDQDSEDNLRLRDKIDAQQRQADILMQDIEFLRKKIRIQRLKLRLLR